MFVPYVDGGIKNFDECHSCRSWMHYERLKNNYLNKVREELFKNAVFLEYTSIKEKDKVVPLPAAKKAKHCLGVLTSLKKKETFASFLFAKSSL